MRLPCRMPVSVRALCFRTLLGEGEVSCSTKGRPDRDTPPLDHSSSALYIRTSRLLFCLRCRPPLPWSAWPDERSGMSHQGRDLRRCRLARALQQRVSPPCSPGHGSVLQKASVRLAGAWPDRDLRCHLASDVYKPRLLEPRPPRPSVPTSNPTGGSLQSGATL